MKVSDDFEVHENSTTISVLVPQTATLHNRMLTEHAPAVSGVVPVSVALITLVYMPSDHFSNHFVVALLLGHPHRRGKCEFILISSVSYFMADRYNL